MHFIASEIGNMIRSVVYHQQFSICCRSLETIETTETTETISITTSMNYQKPVYSSNIAIFSDLSGHFFRPSKLNISDIDHKTGKLADEQNRIVPENGIGNNH